MQPQSLVLIVATLLLIGLTGIQAQSLHGTITFDNQSGEPALVKLIGPTGHVVEVPHGQTRTVNVAPGEYYLLARYGTDSSRYTYSRGNPFKVEETGTQYSVLTITLHKVVGGNYPTRTTSREEFDKAASVPKDPEGKDRFALEGRITSGYNSLCQVEPRRPSNTVTIRPGAGYELNAGCKDLDRQSLVPLEMTVSNRSTTDTANFRIPLLSEVTIRVGERSEAALAFYVPWGTPRGFATALKGVLEVAVPPLTTIDLLYLLPKTAEQAIVHVEGHGVLKLMGQK